MLHGGGSPVFSFHVEFLFHLFSIFFAEKNKFWSDSLYMLRMHVCIYIAEM